MSANKNHHYVPQFYFRNFNGGTNAICLLLMKNGQVRLCASIKGQCAKNQFYGTPAIDKAFSGLEGIHAAPIRALIKAGETGDMSPWKNADMFPWLLQAVLFQRLRTLLEVEKQSAAHEKIMMYWFTEELRRRLPPGEVDKAVAELAEARIVQQPTAAVLMQIKISFQQAPLLLDLQTRVIRNQTDRPFIFSDSPVVFYNSYYRRITDRGVLGLTTPGLQIFLPLTSTLQLMLFDGKVYHGACRNGPFVNVTSTQDVEQLNALQLHHSRDSVYFADPANEPYVKQLYQDHKSNIVTPSNEARVRRDLLVRGQPGVEVMHTFEPQLAHELLLSFVTCQPIAPSAYRFSYRSPELIEEHKQLHPDQYSDEDDASEYLLGRPIMTTGQRSQFLPFAAPQRGGLLDVLPADLPRKRVGRNDPCPCGSGKKYKRCCSRMS